MLSYIQNKLALAYRTRLTKEVMDMYLGADGEDQEKIFYKMGLSQLCGSFEPVAKHLSIQRTWTTESRMPTSALHRLTLLSMADKRRQTG